MLKIEGSGKCYGYRRYASLLLAQEIVEKYDQGQSEWNEKRIYDRLHTLMEDALIIWPSFANEFPQNHYDEGDTSTTTTEDPLSVDDFSDEASRDPLRLIDEMESLTSGGQERAILSETAPDISGMLSRDEFIWKVSVHAKTVRRYIQIGEIVPDAVIQVSAHRTNDYYLPQNVIRYAEKYGWQLIDEGNLLPAFIDMIEKMTMSYSYKPIFINAVLSKANAEGEVSLADIIISYREFYNTRRRAGLIIEKPDSIFAKEVYSDDDAKKTILLHPYARFAEMGMVSYDADDEEICIHRAIWDGLNSAEKARLRAILRNSNKASKVVK